MATQHQWQKQKVYLPQIKLDVETYTVIPAAAAADKTPTVVNETTATVTATDGDNNNNMTEAKFLFIQGAHSGSLSEVNSTTSTLKLGEVSDRTILFSDRPDRIVGSVNTTDFIGNWSIGPNNFAVDPHNAVLILDDVIEQRQDLAVIEPYNPVYDPEANTLKYDITAENATTTTTTASINLPGEFGQSTLVIDQVPIMLLAANHYHDSV